MYITNLVGRKFIFKDSPGGGPYEIVGILGSVELWYENPISNGKSEVHIIKGDINATIFDKITLIR